MEVSIIGSLRFVNQVRDFEFFGSCSFFFNNSIGLNFELLFLFKSECFVSFSYSLHVLCSWDIFFSFSFSIESSHEQIVSTDSCSNRFVLLLVIPSNFLMPGISNLSLFFVFLPLRFSEVIPHLRQFGESLSCGAFLCILLVV